MKFQYQTDNYIPALFKVVTPMVTDAQYVL